MPLELRTSNRPEQPQRTVHIHSAVYSVILCSVTTYKHSGNCLLGCWLWFCAHSYVVSSCRRLVVHDSPFRVTENIFNHSQFELRTSNTKKNPRSILLKKYLLANHLPYFVPGGVLTVDKYRLELAGRIALCPLLPTSHLAPHISLTSTNFITSPTSKPHVWTRKGR